MGGCAHLFSTTTSFSFLSLSLSIDCMSERGNTPSDWTVPQIFIGAATRLVAVIVTVSQSLPKRIPGLGNSANWC